MKTDMKFPPMFYKVNVDKVEITVGAGCKSENVFLRQWHAFSFLLDQLNKKCKEAELESPDTFEPIWREKFDRFHKLERHYFPCNELLTKNRTMKKCTGLSPLFFKPFDPNVEILFCFRPIMLCGLCRNYYREWNNENRQLPYSLNIDWVTPVNSEHVMVTWRKKQKTA